MAIKVRKSFQWAEIEQYLDSLVSGLIADMANAEDIREMGDAQGRYKMWVLFRNLPQTIYALELEEQERKELEQDG